MLGILGNCQFISLPSVRSQMRIHWTWTLTWSITTVEDTALMQAPTIEVLLKTEISWNIPRFDYFAQIEAKVCEECQVFSFLSRTFPVTDIRCCFCILCSVRQPSLPNMRLKCKKFSMLNCTPWGKNWVSGILFVWIDMGWLVDPKKF